MTAFAETGSHVVYARALKDEPFPHGIWYWDVFREMQHPLTEQESRELSESRYVPLVAFVQWQRGSSYPKFARIV